MLHIRGFYQLLKADLKMYLREPAATFFTLMFPALLLAISGYSFGQEVVLTTPSGVEMRILDLMLPATLAWVMATQGLLGVYPMLTMLRETKVLKYYRTHPIRPLHILVSQYLIGLLMLAVSLAILLVVAEVLFGLRYDGQAGFILLSIVVAYTAFFAMGFALAGVTPSARAAQALGSVLFFPMMFLSGAFGPREPLPPALKFLSDLSPLTHATDLLTDFWVSGPITLGDALSHPLHSFKGTPFLGRTWFEGVTAAQALGYLLVISLVAALVALRAFRWDEEPRSRTRRTASPAQDAPADAVVWVQDLHKAYGPVRAVNGVSFHVNRGEIFGLLGPNGAGKTTTLEIVEGLRAADAGQVRVLGFDPGAEPEAIVRRVGVQLQEASLPSRLKVRELLDLFAAFYDRTLPAERLLDTLELQEQADAFFGKLSGGQKQRVFAALALLNDPEVVFLDEITTGLDAHIRRRIWAFLRELRREGKTIVLTTHYLEEAQALCDRVVMLDQGQVVAQGTPEDLIARLGMGFRLEVEIGDGVALAPEAVQGLPGVSRWSRQNGTLTLYLHAAEDTERVLSALRAHGITYRSLKAQPATLEDVFLALTNTQ